MNASIAKNPKLSVCLTVYNHENFLATSLDYILAQQTDFDFEIVIGDDASIDNSRQILLSYQEAYPDRIVLLLNEKNIGVFQNGINILQKAKGQYIAMSDGDDYWVYPKKLQYQVNFLDQNPDYAGCFHDSKILPVPIEGEEVGQYFFERKYYSQFNFYNPDFYPWDLVERNIIATNTLVFRNRQLYNELKGYEDVNRSLSWLYQLLIIKQSKFKYFNEPWSVYNNHKGGITKTHPKKAFTHSNIRVLKALLHDPYYSKISHHIYFSLMREYERLFYNEPEGASRAERIKILLSFLRYGQQYIWTRLMNLWTQL